MDRSRCELLPFLVAASSETTPVMQLHPLRKMVLGWIVMNQSQGREKKMIKAGFLDVCSRQFPTWKTSKSGFGFLCYENMTCRSPSYVSVSVRVTV